MRWLDSQNTRQCDWSRTIVARSRSPRGPLPLFLATSRVINSVTAIKLVPVKRSALTPELKAFIDHAIVPALVKAYLAESPAEEE
jgi:hypothetical protein